MGQQNIITEIVEERKRQDEKWGVRNQLHTWWLVILLEEVGECAKALLEGDGLRNEIIQSAAVCLAWLENIERESDSEEKP